MLVYINTAVYLKPTCSISTWRLVVLATLCSPFCWRRSNCNNKDTY